MHFAKIAPKYQPRLQGPFFVKIVEEKALGRITISRDLPPQRDKPQRIGLASRRTVDRGQGILFSPVPAASRNDD